MTTLHETVVFTSSVIFKLRSRGDIGDFSVLRLGENLPKSWFNLITDSDGLHLVLKQTDEFENLKGQTLLFVINPLHRDSSSFIEDDNEQNVLSVLSSLINMVKITNKVTGGD